MNFETFGGRTFLLTVGCGAVTSVMRWFDKLDNGSWTAVIIASVCAYIAKSGWDEHGKVKAETQKAIAKMDSGMMPLGPR